MNYLGLTNRLKLECGVSGPKYTTALNQTGEAERLSTWINSAWLDIQSLRLDWEWMRKSFSFETVQAQVSYTPLECGITDFGDWARDTMRNYNTAAGIGSEIFMDYIDYDYWRDTYLIGALRSTYSQPTQVTITPDKSLAFGPITMAGYTVDGDYYSVPTEFVANDEIPSMPTEFHMMIVYRAMMDYGGYEAASEVYQRGEKGYKGMLDRIGIDRLPEITFSGSLA